MDRTTADATNAKKLLNEIWGTINPAKLAPENSNEVILICGTNTVAR